MADDGRLLFEWEEAARITNGVLYAPKSGKSAGFKQVSVDSRAVSEGALFAALPGENADGHDFVKSAFDKDAAGALLRADKINSIIENAALHGAFLIAVDNPLAALQRLAAAHLDKFPRLVRAGITGSSGKTTTKEIAAAMIGREKNVICNIGNLNSDIGLPLSVFNVRQEHEVCVFELGMNRAGEIEEIARVLRPHFALITNIGRAHIGIIGSKEEIAKEKKKIFSFFTGNETALIPSDCEYAKFLSEGVNGKVIFYSKDKTPLKIEKDLGIKGWDILYGGYKSRFPLPGLHNVENAGAAAALCAAIGIEKRSIAAGLSCVKPLFGRSEIFEKKINGASFTVINDCYNANPDSMEKALSFFEKLEWKGRKIIIAGEMFELGEKNEEEHKKLFLKLENLKTDKKYFFHISKMNFISVSFPVYDDIEKLKNEIYREIKTGDLILLKGSRSCALERVFQDV